MGPLVAGSLQVAETTQTGEQCAAVRHLAADTSHPITQQVQVCKSEARDASDYLPIGSVATGPLTAEPTMSTSNEVETTAGAIQLDGLLLLIPHAAPEDGEDHCEEAAAPAASGASQAMVSTEEVDKLPASSSQYISSGWTEEVFQILAT